MLLKQEIWKQAVDIISSFEGSGYTNITGNFDGAYLSIGLIQWNFGQDTLQPLFKAMIERYPTVYSSAMGTAGDSLKKAITIGTERQWALRVQVDNKVQEPYLTALRNLCSTPEFQSIQREYMDWYKDNAINMCDKFNLITDRAFVLMFDISVNNGSIKNPPDLTGMSYLEKLIALAESAARQKGKWYQDSMSRKLTIINGGGVVHEDKYSFNFIDTSAFEDVMFNDEDDIGAWAKPSIKKLTELGLIRGGSGNFNPRDPLTREQFAVVIDRLLKIIGR